jgi:uncharacterized membrane protein HdeD (DUF308 family)
MFACTMKSSTTMILGGTALLLLGIVLGFNFAQQEHAVTESFAKHLVVKSVSSFTYGLGVGEGYALGKAA